MSAHQAAIERQTLAEGLLKCGPWYCTDDDEALVTHARTQARAVANDAARLSDEATAYTKAAYRVRCHQLDVPEEYGIRGGLARMSCDIWWRRQLRRLNARRLEQRERVLGRVHDRAGIYMSERGYRAHRAQKNRNVRAMEAVAAINQFGQEYTLAELAELGLANPEHRRAELMLRISDTEDEANRLGHVGMFYTLTAPSRFHAIRKGTARTNPKWSADGAPTPRDAQQYLQKTWAKIRAKLKRDGLGIYGIRVVEPHHDGCPHWHLLLWMPADAEPAVTTIMRRYALEDTPDEVAGDESRRFKPVKIDPAKGCAAGYVAKYIAKNINGTQFNRGEVDGDHLDHYGHDLISSAPRIESWAATWGIRQFQFLGLPSVTVWREIRRLKDEQTLRNWEAATRPDSEAAAILGEVRRAAIGNRWDKFVNLMGGPMATRLAQPIRPWRVIRLSAEPIIDAGTGEQHHDQRGRYGEPLAATFGLTVASSTGEADYLTRFFRWEFRHQEATDAGASNLTFAGHAGAWTCVTNCTEPPGPDITPPANPPYGLADPAGFEIHKAEAWHLGEACHRQLNVPRTFKDPTTWQDRHYPAIVRLTHDQVADIRRNVAQDVAAYQGQCVTRSLIAEEKRREREANRERWDQARQLIAGWLQDGELSPCDLTPIEIEVLTA
ncbi:replication endonuclease [Halomonas caseinilytica]|uniref:replication endonuclease n=1 Tax=Halomonas caseinilytica TaxID=438744 RepID=UPI000848A6ED|nr:replication endonuclease [Halomonas caseinilytica]